MKSDDAQIRETAIRMLADAATKLKNFEKIDRADVIFAATRAAVTSAVRQETNMIIWNILNGR